ncbi:MAG TPA: YitT family protein [Chitinophagaceae bacterium]|jgi:uncharacterized membrane-anchored protein YitT (DUF2179 family)/predicted metal-dependent HD superfamily phosphohydrolase|nr:YitT family protein [Chitinophagaceae bacterium]
MRYEQAYSFLMQKLERELSPDFTYHNTHHTNSVIKVAEQLANKENIEPCNVEILNTASLFHDAGFLDGYKNHEEISCKLAKSYLPDFGYTETDINQVCRLIMATKLPQAPSNILESIICDADLHYLGTDRYFAISENLFHEYIKLGIVKNRAEWRKKQIQFFTSHRYFTESAIREYEAKKQENLRLLKKEDIAIQKDHGLAATIQDILLMIVGVIIAGFALKGFLVPNKFFDGGITGISLLVHELYDLHLGLVILVCNLPFIIASYFSVSRRFALRTFLCVLLLAFCLLWIPYPTVTTDKLLISIFGGVFLGIGMGLTMRMGSALDGIEVLALYTWKRTSFTITEIIMALNIIIFGIAAFKFGMETALYSVLTYLAATKTVDYVVEGIEAYTGVTIISGNSELIKQRLVNELGRSITIYKGERGYLPGKFEISADCDIIFTVITRLELRKLKNLVYEADPKAFVFANTIKEASGGIIKRRHVH